MIYVRHRSASGRLDELWEYDPARHVVIATLRQGTAEPIDLTIPIASEARARYGAWKLVREGEDNWKVTPHRFGSERLIPHPIHRALGTNALVLLAAPWFVSAELELA